MKKLIRRFFKWVLAEELERLQNAEEKLVRNKCRIDFVEGKIKDVNESIGIMETKTDEVRFVLKQLDVSVDVYEYRFSPSWDVISIQGENTDYIKFIDLGKKDIRDIAHFLRQYERSRCIKVDSTPNLSEFLRISRKKSF